ncbi:MAG: ATP-binding cassette domain-containing protein [Acetobacteraceae bacterium]|nr:ATP-binding cassette domain-containing protein [Acetobacteraceae bacterium]
MWTGPAKAGIIAPRPGSAMSEAAQPLLDVRAVTLQYRTAQRIVTATHRVSFSVYPADRFVLLGPSGCGKSSLLKAVGGYLEPVEGEFRLRGRRISEPGPDRMMVFQEFDQLLPWKTVRENITFPLLATRRVSASSAANGSSISRISGSIAMPRAIATRCFMPPDSVCG